MNKTKLMVEILTSDSFDKFYKGELEDFITGFTGEQICENRGVDYLTGMNISKEEITNKVFRIFKDILED